MACPLGILMIKESGLDCPAHLRSGEGGGVAAPVGKSVGVWLQELIVSPVRQDRCALRIGCRLGKPARPLRSILRCDGRRCMVLRENRKRDSLASLMKHSDDFRSGEENSDE